MTLHSSLKNVCKVKSWPVSHFQVGSNYIISILSMNHTHVWLFYVLSLWKFYLHTWSRMVSTSYITWVNAQDFHSQFKCFSPCVELLYSFLPDDCVVYPHYSSHFNQSILGLAPIIYTLRKMAWYLSVSVLFGIKPPNTLITWKIHRIKHQPKHQ